MTNQTSPVTATLPAWEDPDVQIVYETLCKTPAPRNEDEHWEGWVARHIVQALRGHAQCQQEPVAWLSHYDGHADATTNRDTMCQWKDTLGRTITPLYALADTSTVGNSK